MWPQPAPPSLPCLPSAPLFPFLFLRSPSDSALSPASSALPLGEVDGGERGREGEGEGAGSLAVVSDGAGWDTQPPSPLALHPTHWTPPMRPPSYLQPPSAPSAVFLLSSSTAALDLSSALARWPSPGCVAPPSSPLLPLSPLPPLLTGCPAFSLALPFSAAPMEWTVALLLQHAGSLPSPALGQAYVGGDAGEEVWVEQHSGEEGRMEQRSGMEWVEQSSGERWIEPLQPALLQGGGRRPWSAAPFSDGEAGKDWGSSGHVHLTRSTVHHTTAHAQQTTRPHCPAPPQCRRTVHLITAAVAPSLPVRRAQRRRGAADGARRCRKRTSVRERRPTCPHSSACSSSSASSTLPSHLRSSGRLSAPPCSSCPLCRDGDIQDRAVQDPLPRPHVRLWVRRGAIGTHLARAETPTPASMAPTRHRVTPIDVCGGCAMRCGVLWCGALMWCCGGVMRCCGCALGGVVAVGVSSRMGWGSCARVSLTGATRRSCARRTSRAAPAPSPADARHTRNTTHTHPHTHTHTYTHTQHTHHTHRSIMHMHRRTSACVSSSPLPCAAAVHPRRVSPACG